MKKIVGIIGFVLLCSHVGLAAEPLSGAQVNRLFQNRTFLASYQNGDKYQLFFSADGRISALLQQDKHSTRLMKTGSWQVRHENALCVKYIRNTTAGKKRRMRCGKIVQQSKTSFQRLDEDGKPFAVFTFQGEGNLL